MASPCALCEHLALEPRPADNSIGVRTSSRVVIDRAQDLFTRNAEGLTHILVPVCAEHAADVFRGRIEGVEMAWRLVEPRLTDRPHSVSSGVPGVTGR